MTVENLPRPEHFTSKDERQDTARQLEDIGFHQRKSSRLASALHSIFEDREELYLDKIDFIGVKELVDEVVFHANAVDYLAQREIDKKIQDHLRKKTKSA